MSNESKAATIESMKAMFTPEQLQALGHIMSSEAKATKKVKVTKVPQGVSGRADVPCTAVIGDYKGKPTITLSRGEQSFINKPFTFGQAKAQMIVEQFEAIKKFAEIKA